MRADVALMVASVGGNWPQPGEYTCICIFALFSALHVLIFRFGKN